MKKNFELTRRREYTCRNAVVRVLVTWFACRLSYLVLSLEGSVFSKSPHSLPIPTCLSICHGPSRTGTRNKHALY